MGSKPTEAAEHDADVFLERMRKAVSLFGPVRVRELACEIALRYVGALGEDSGSTRAMIQEAHTLAATQPLSQAQFEEWAGILNEMSVYVDPAPSEAEQQSMREALRERWLWKGVQEEKRWLAAYVERGVKLAPEPPTTKAPEPPAAKAPAPPAAKPAAPPAAPRARRGCTAR